MVGSTSTDSVKAVTTRPRAAARCGVGIADDQGHVEGLVPVAELLEQPVVAAHLAVVTGEHHQGGVGQAQVVEVVEQPAQLVVDFLLGPVVGGPHLAPLGLVFGSAGRREVHQRPVERVGAGLLRLGRRRRERWHVVGVIEIVVADRVAARRMGPDERGVDEEGLVAVLVQPGGEGFDHEHRLRLIGSEPGRRPGRPVGVGPREVGDREIEIVRVGRDVDALGGQPPPPLPASGLPRLVEHGPESGQHLLVGAEPGIVCGEVPGIETGVRVSEEDGIVAGLSGQQGHVGEAGVERGAVAHRSVAVQIGPRVQAGPGRPTRRGVGPVVGEQRALGRQSVEGRGGEYRMPESRQTVAPPLVDGDEQHVPVHGPVPVRRRSSAGIIPAMSAGHSGGRTR